MRWLRFNLEKRIKEEQEKIRQWEIKFDEEQKKKEEELIRKFYRDSEVDKTDTNEVDKTDTSEVDKTNNNYEEKS